MFRRFSKVLAVLLAAAAGALPLAGCGGGSGAPGGRPGSPNDDDLAVAFFSHGSRTNVYRDQRLEIRFTAPVKKSTVSDRTIQIRTGPSLQTAVEGALIVDGNRVIFDPTLSQHRYEQLGEGASPDRPYGFEPLAQHQVFIPAPPVAKTLTNRAGSPIVSQFVATFTTGEGYNPELISPEFIGINGSGALGFVPDRNDDGSVPFDAQIAIEFSEPMDPGSLIPASTVIVSNEDVLDFTGKPIPIPGTIRTSPDGRVFYFVPSFHYGTGPYRISVALTQGIRDRSGNPLANPQVLFFTSELNSDVDTISLITESFSNNLKQDFVNTVGGEWNTTTPGELRGGAITSTQVLVHYIGDNINSRNLLVDYPLVSKDGNSVCPSWPNGVHVQASFSALDIGVSGSVTEVYWGPSSNALFAATHPNIKMRLGHTKDTEGILSTKFEENFLNGVPQPHYDGEYVIPQDANVNVAPGTIPPAGFENHWPFPSLTTPFDYNGTNGLLIDWQVDPANDCQLMRAFFWGIPGAPGTPGKRNIVAKSKEGTADNFTGGGQELVYDMGFLLRRRITTAQSQFYDTAQGQPNFGEPIISPPSQAGGASYLLEWQGADGMPDPVFTFLTIPDPATFTPWSGSIDIADNHRFVRFRLTLIANLTSNTVTRFTQIQMPFSFRP